MRMMSGKRRKRTMIESRRTTYTCWSREKGGCGNLHGSIVTALFCCRREGGRGVRVATGGEMESATEEGPAPGRPLTEAEWQELEEFFYWLDT